MAIIFNQSGFCAGEDVVIKEPTEALTFSGSKVLTLICSNEQIRSMLVRILKGPDAKKDLLHWVPYGETIIIVTKAGVYQATRHRDACAQISKCSLPLVLGEHTGLLRLLLRTRLSTETAIILGSWIHAKFIKSVIHYTYDETRVVSRKVVPPMLVRALTFLAVFKLRH